MEVVATFDTVVMVALGYEIQMSIFPVLVSHLQYLQPSE